MSFSNIWDTPFLEIRHRDLAMKLLQWDIPDVEQNPSDFNHPVRTLLKAMAKEELLDLVVPRCSTNGEIKIDLRAICIVREILAYRSGGMADSAFVMQGIGTAALWLSHSTGLMSHYLERARRGDAICAFALTEPDHGSDVAHITTSAARDGADFILNGEKIYITNAGIADHYLVLARTGEAPGSKGLTAFLVEASITGLVVTQQAFIAPHAGGTVSFRDCRVPAVNMVGKPGEGFRLAMNTFDIFRTSVGAAALGFGRRALEESLTRTENRKLFDQPMNQIEGVQSKLADMLTEIESAGLVVYRSAWAKDTLGGSCRREVSMAKMVATEAAQKVIDSAVQLFGGGGVLLDSVVERLYREIRPLRIYEGASEVQKLIIARDLIRGHKLS